MTIKNLNTKGVITCVSIVVCLVITSVLLLGFVFPKQITIVDSGSEINVMTLATTVEDVLKEKNISLNEGDRVVPPANSQIKDGGTISIYRLKNINVIADGKTTVITSNAENVYGALKDGGIVLGDFDLLSVDGDTELTEGMTVEVFRAKFVKVTVDGVTHERYTARPNVKAFLDSVCIFLEEHDEITPYYETPITEGLEIVISRVTIGEEVFEEDIPYNTIRKQSSEYYQGKTVTTQEGQNGRAKNTYNVVRRDGEIVTKTLLNSETIVEPVDAIVTTGTKVPQVAETGGILASRGDLRYRKVIECTATAYEPGVQSNGKWAGITATGRVAGPGIVAVDPSVIPLNSRLYIESTDDGKSWSYGYAIAGDTGGAIKGNKIDLCYSTVEECYQFGRRQFKVYILE